MRRLTLAVLTLLLALGFGAARPHAAQADNAAIAINTKDGAAIFKFAFSIRRVGGEIVDETNAAVAFASCTDCQTIAIAIQVVLITGDPSEVTPENLALAVNVECTLCATLASAYQFVFSTGGQVHFTAEGNRALAELRREFHLLRQDAPNLTLAEVQARVDDLVARLREVLADELVPAGRSGQAGGTDTETQPAETQPPETQPTTTETAPTTTETTPTTIETAPTTTATTPTTETTETTETAPE